MCVDFVNCLICGQMPQLVLYCHMVTCAPSLAITNRNRISKKPVDSTTNTEMSVAKEKLAKPSDSSRTKARSGRILESIDDDVLLVNQLKHKLKKDNEPSQEDPKETTDLSWQEQSEYFKNIDVKSFRQYDLACSKVKEFYLEQHEKQTVAYNIQARINFKTKVRARMSIWEGLERLNKLLDESDPDTELTQIDHALQTAEAIRRDKKPRWMQLVGLIHDLGKLLYFFNSEGQWDVVGDTFPVGCKFLKKIIFPDSFARNPDFSNPLYNTKYGIYSKHCGLDKVMLSWGHDEYMYHIAKANSKLPPEALAMIRYHSFYPWHQENAYSYLMDEHDKEMLQAVRAFNKYDLYSKADEQYSVDELRQYYIDLIDEFFPQRIIDF